MVAGEEEGRVAIVSANKYTLALLLHYNNIIKYYCYHYYYVLSRLTAAAPALLFAFRRYCTGIAFIVTFYSERRSRNAAVIAIFVRGAHTHTHRKVSCTRTACTAVVRTVRVGYRGYRCARTDGRR